MGPEDIYEQAYRDAERYEEDDFEEFCEEWAEYESGWD